MSTSTADLLPPSATLLERATAAVLAPQVDPSVLRTLGDSTRIPVGALPWLAWGASADGWQEAQTEASRRALVRGSIEIHQRKGTAGAIRRVLGAIGATVELSEWQSSGGAPYTFTLTVWAGDELGAGNAGLINLELYSRIRRMVDVVKNERSHYTLSVGARLTGALRVATAASITGVTHISAQAAPVQPSPLGQSLRLASAGRAISIVRASMES